MDRSTDLGRRRFLAGLSAAGATMGYMLSVDASADEIRQVFDQIAPPGEGNARFEGEPNMTLVDLETDFLVAGGGMAGVCAAISAARNGARVVLVQDRSRLGGNASSEVRMHIVGADAHRHRHGWREGGLLEEFRLENAATNPHYEWELWDLMLYDKVVSEPGITLLLDSTLYAAKLEEGSIQEVMVRCDRTEHLYRIRAKYFADCTGDCRLALEAGATMRSGIEARSEFNESLAPEEASRETLGSSILFTSRDYGHPVPFTPPKWARKVTEEQLKFRHHASWEYGYWWIEWGGKMDTIRDNERIRFELLSYALGVWDHIKNSGMHPSSETWGMKWIGMIPGKRESRRIVGDHILTQSDLNGVTGDFEDAVAIGGWPFDDHPPGGFDDIEARPSKAVQVKDVYNIPLRALYSKDINNLFMAGRNISATHVAFTSTRVMGTCAVEGQAIGTAAALCIRYDLAPQGLYTNKQRLSELQQVLLRDDQTIRNRKNEDPHDLARSAKVRASGEVEGSSAENVLNGFVRDIPGEWKNRWGGPMTGEGAWIELSWDTPKKIGRVQITFDSGFHRQLTLTEQASVQKEQEIRPQPETVKDYEVLCRKAGEKEFVSVAQVEGNYQRLKRHDFAPLDIDCIRIQIHSTNGSPEARIFEVRCE